MYSYKITSEWSDILTKVPHDIYSTEAYVKLYQEGPSQARCFVFSDGNNYFLLPFLIQPIDLLGNTYYDFETQYGYGGPLVNTGNEDFIKAAWDAFIYCCAEEKIVAGILRFHPFFENVKLFSLYDTPLFIRKTVSIDLRFSEEELWSNVSKVHRRAIKKAEKMGLTYEVDETLSKLDLFKSLYNETMNKVDAADFYFFTDDYFDKIRSLGESVFLAFINSNGDSIAGAIFFKSGGYGHYHLGGSREEYLSLRPNNMLFYRTALYLKEKGNTDFHLGGGNSADEEDGLFVFKKRFSGRTHDFFLGKIVTDKENYEKVCRLWEEKNPEKKEKYKNFVLKYRF